MIEFIFPEELTTSLDEVSIRERAALAYEFLSMDDKVISIKFCDDEEMHGLNKTYRGVNDTTDILSFNLDYEDPLSSKYYLGDIVISLPRAEKQAKEHVQSIEDEITFLLIHGMLHLLGHDHAEEEEKKVMFSRQEEIFQKVRGM